LTKPWFGGADGHIRPAPGSAVIYGLFRSTYKWPHWKYHSGELQWINRKKKIWFRT
jgi:hypothetical protein